MKRRNIALTLMATFCFSGVIGDNKTYADNPFEKFIPRGKLLKKLKDEFTGEPEELKIPDPRRVVQRRGGTPTPARRSGQVNQASQQRVQSPTPTRPLPPLSASAGSSTKGASKGVSSRGPGFGMMLQAKGNDQLVVSAIQRNGNAARSGLRVGDQVVSAGGGKLSSMEEFKQIAKTLGQGDQIEVEFVRNGKKQKSLLQFGVAPEEGQIASAAQTSTKHIHSEVSEIGMQSVLDSPVEHVSRLEPILTSSTKPSTGKITSLNQTIEQQQQKMQAMAEELKLLRKAHQPAVEPTENNWSFPDLAGPGQ